MEILSSLLFIIFICVINIQCQTYFRDIKKIHLNDNDHYFVVFTDGLYLYNYNLLDCVKLFNFNSTVYQGSDDIIILTKLENENGSYILCLINKYLFIYNINHKALNYYLLDDIDISKDNYCNLMPYNINNNNPNFFIVLYKKGTKTLNFYCYDFNNANKILNKLYQESFDNVNITDDKINCQINAYLSYINCFYYYKINNQNYL